MARPGGNPTLRGCGKKGRSGRKPVAVEFAKTQVITKAWEKILANIDDSDVKDIALPIVLKTLTNKHDLTSGEKIIDIYSKEQIEFIARRALNLDMV